MIGPVVRRVGHAVVTLLVASVLVFALQGLAPGDPAGRVLTARGVSHPNREQIEAQRRELGLDRNPIARYLDWLGGAIRGDLGTSWTTGRPVRDELARRLPATIVLTVAALAFALATALALSIVAARWANRWPDAAVRTVTMGGLVLPSFFVGTVLLEVVVVRWGHFRVVADGTWSTVLLPAVVLAIGPAAVWTRILRSGLLDAHDAGHARVAESRGVGRGRQLFIHDLPNALVPFLTAFGVGAAALLGGAPIVETVFTWPGVGRFAVGAITARDVPVVQGFTLLAITAFVIVSLIVDLAIVAIDPRHAPAPRSGARRRRAAAL